VEDNSEKNSAAIEEKSEEKLRKCEQRQRVAVCKETRQKQQHANKWLVNVNQIKKADLKISINCFLFMS
jgi:hypothetical protein